jgi:hypothetical protein
LKGGCAAGGNREGEASFGVVQCLGGLVEFGMACRSVRVEDVVERVLSSETKPSNSTHRACLCVCMQACVCMCVQICTWQREGGEGVGRAWCSTCPCGDALCGVRAYVFMRTCACVCVHACLPSLRVSADRFYRHSANGMACLCECLGVLLCRLAKLLRHKQCVPVRLQRRCALHVLKPTQSKALVRPLHGVCVRA